MVAEAHRWVDVEGAMRAWGRATLPELDGRVFFAPSNAAIFPQIVLFRVGGLDDNCLIQFDVWAKNKEVAAVLAAKLATKLDELSRFVDGSVILLGASVDGIRWLPDEENPDFARYILDAIVTAAFNPLEGS